MDIYERVYPRLVYNGEIYDARSDQVSWDNRRDVNPQNNSVEHRDSGYPLDFVANVRFLSEQNRIYLGLAESALDELDEVIAVLPGLSG